MAVLDLQNLIEVGTSPATYQDASIGGDRAPNPSSRTRIWVINDGAAHKIVFTSHRPSNFGPYPDLILDIPAGTFYPIPALSAKRFNHTDGHLDFIFTDANGDPDIGTPTIQIAAVEDESILKDPV